MTKAGADPQRCDRFPNAVGAAGPTGSPVRRTLSLRPNLRGSSSAAVFGEFVAGFMAGFTGKRTASFTAECPAAFPLNFRGISAEPSQYRFRTGME
ncbi:MULTISPECIES: hypothetical protein [Cupriavidus]|uniref:Uncharacterized protein n=1 Tax=Cupriavidus cauae TaxID=2608999 RepID=A0A5M8ADP7_9BURK|nr:MULTISPECIES: hypothetical protein [Cupriavidus]KAA6121483.1 hypothetical protein F1599_15790 [Cupriavidus cauae]MCA7086734.1 hypothetical protein [Cupriavidus sp. DB3]